MPRSAVSRLPLTLVLAVGVAFPAGADKLDPNNPPVKPTEREVKIGTQATEEIEKSKSLKILDPKSSPSAQATYDKLSGIIKKLGAVSSRPGIEYSAKVIQNKEINAFTLPNGKVYVFTGLLDAVASDDELAAVLAHEIGHNTQLHALRGEQKAKKLNWVTLAALAAMLSGSTDGVNVAQFSQYAMLGIMNRYSVEFEKEADKDALDMMVKAGYNPSALVTFMRRLQLEEDRRPKIDAGIFQTHPASHERVEAALEDLEKRGLDFMPRVATNAGEVVVSEADKRWQLKLHDTVLLEVANDGPKSRERADTVASRISAALLSGVKSHEMTTTSDGKLLARDQVLIQATPADAALTGKTAAVAAQGWLQNFQRLFWREQLNGRF